jgi:glyceraldehyde 3-phosphate dehydrogenase
MKKKIAINGFGRIGRVFLRQAFENENLEIAAINDIDPASKLSDFLNHDPIYGPFAHPAREVDGKLVIGSRQISVFQEKDPANLPWADLDIDIVVESTGVFETSAQSIAHINAGAKRVVITAPPEDNVTPVATPNLNLESLASSPITSNGSCTTNATVPLIAILKSAPGIEKITINTVHAYTANQKDISAPTILPTDTGANTAVTKVIPEMSGMFHGIELRVPVSIGSILDFTFVAKNNTTTEEINRILKDAALGDWKEIVSVSDKPLNSRDIIGDPHGSIVDLTLTQVVDGNLVKIMAWYDNEWGYAAMLLKHVLNITKLI